MRILASILALAGLLCGCASDAPWKHQSFAFQVSDPAPATASTNTIALLHVWISPLFQSQSFTYRVGPNTYEQDPYASFLVPPDRAIAEAVRSNLHSFGRVVEPGGALVPSLGAEVAVTKLFGDFQDATNLSAALQLHFLVYQMGPDGPGHVVLDETCGRAVSLNGKTPAALIAAWDADLRDIMDQINSDYAKANSNDSR